MNTYFFVNKKSKNCKYESIFFNKIKKVKITPKGSPGQILIVGIVFMAVILILSAALFSRVTSYIRFNSNDITREQATNLAEAGLEKALWQLNQTAGSYPGETDTPLGTTGTFTTSIQPKTSTLKTITATGYVPNSTNPRAKRTVKVDVSISGEQISFRYAVQVGDGGVDMDNSSRIEGTVFTNGNIDGSGSTVITGDAWAAGTISPGDPTVLGTKHPGASPTPLPAIGPPCDILCWKNAASNGNPYTGSCTLSSGTTDLGPTKIPCSTFTVQNSATLRINGPIWVAGNVTVQNSAKIKLNDSFGSQGTVMIVDGTVQTQNSGGFEPTVSNPKGYILVVSTSTSSDAIQIQNSGANAIFYALSGGAQLSNSAHATALIANSLHTQNSATVTYDQGLAGSEFSAGPGGSWQIKKGTYRFTQ